MAEGLLHVRIPSCGRTANSITAPPQAFALRLSSAMSVPAARTCADRPKQRWKARRENFSVLMVLPQKD